MKKLIALGFIALLLFAPIFYQHVGSDRQEKVWYSLAEHIEMNIAEHQWLWPGWD